MQPLQPSPSPQPDPLFPTSREQSGPAKTSARPGGAPIPLRESSTRRADPIRLTPSIKIYHRMRPGKLYPLTVELSTERDLSHGAVADVGLSAGGPVVSVQPVIPGAVISPATVELPAATGGKANFWVCPSSRRGMRHKDARVEFRAGARLLLTVRTPARSVTRRAAWFFLLLAIGLPCVFAFIRAYPLGFAAGELVMQRPAAGAPPAAPGRNPAGPAAAPVPDKKDATPDKKSSTSETKDSATERKDVPKSEEKKPGTVEKPSGPTPPAGARPGAGQPGGDRPPRAGGGGAAAAMQVPIDPEVAANVRKPLDTRDKLDRYITVTAGHVYGKDQQNHLAPASVRTPPKDMRELLYQGLYVIKDGWKISDTRRIPGLLDAYECIFERTLDVYQDWMIAGLLLVVAALLWFIQSASSRRIQGGVLEILPA